MKCEYCGGNMSLEDERCPHCGQLNKHAQQHIKDMKHYKGEFEQTREGVYESTRKYTQATVRMIIIAVLVIVIVILGVVYSNVWSFGRMIAQSDAKRNYKEYSANLDKYMEEEDFWALARFQTEHAVGNLDLYKDYYPIMRAAGNYCDVCDYIMRIATPPKYDDRQQNITYLNENLDYFYIACDLERYSYIDNIDREENIMAINCMKQNIRNLLKTYCNFTEEDVTQFESLSKAKRGALLEERLEEVMADE